MPPLLAELLSSDRTIAPQPTEAMRRAVSFELTRDRRRVSAKQPGDLQFGNFLGMQPSYLVTFLSRNMISGHRWGSVRTPFRNHRHSNLPTMVLSTNGLSRASRAIA